MHIKTNCFNASGMWPPQALETLQEHATTQVIHHEIIPMSFRSVSVQPNGTLLEEGVVGKQLVCSGLPHPMCRASSIRHAKLSGNKLRKALLR